MASPKRHVDHRCLDVGVTRCLHDRERIGPRHRHLRPKRVAECVNVDPLHYRPGVTCPPFVDQPDAESVIRERPEGVVGKPVGFESPLRPNG